MVRSSDCLKKYGLPDKANPWMTLWDVPIDLQIGVIPKRIYCNKDLIIPLQSAFINLISRGYAESELLTWDGCFNIRHMTGGVNWSLHSWGIAIDVNAFENGYGEEPVLSSGFVECFTDAGFDWGGDWKTPDGMHFQLSKI
jgi:hypothetical protein